MWFILIIAAAAAALVLWYIAADNSFKHMGIKIEESRSCLEASLIQKSEILSRLSDERKSYGKYQEDVSFQWIRLHRGMNADEMAEANRRLDAMSVQLHTSVQACPELYSSEFISQLRRSAADTQEQLQEAGMRYNSYVMQFNTKKAVFPSDIPGRKYEEYPFFQVNTHRWVHMEMQFHPPGNMTMAMEEIPEPGKDRGKIL